MTSDLGVDLDVLASWMDGQGLGTGPIAGAEVLTGGTQNILLRFVRDERVYVLRRPPVHKRANSDETMRREARVLAALAGSDVPHPALIAACPDSAVLGAAFYLMEPVDGFNAKDGLPEPLASDRGRQHRLGLSMIDAVAAVGRVDLAERGLTDFGRADGWLERQVGRWRRQLDSYAGLDGYPGCSLPHVDEVGTWLDEHRPSRCYPGLMHGDFHVANVLIRRDTPEVAAIVDWELATIGDPLLDLGHLLATWPTRPASVAPLDAPGLPTEPELIERYAERSGRDVEHVSWFYVLACYRLGIILEGSYARAFAGLTPRDVGDRLGGIARALLTQAHETVSGPG